MKKKFKKALGPLAFVLVFVLILTGLSVFFVPKYATDFDSATQSEKRSQTIYYEEKNTVDFLAIGDSETYTSISPMEIFHSYGFTGFVSAVPSIRMQQIYYNLEDIYAVQKPQVVLLECNAVFRKTGGRLKQLQLTAEGLLQRAFPVFKNHNNWKNMLTDWLQGQQVSGDADPLKGFDYRCSIKPYKGGEYMQKTSKTVDILQTNRLYLDKIRNLCAEKGSQLILYNAPSPKNSTYAKHNVIQEYADTYGYEKHNAIQRYADKYGLTYVDFNLLTDELQIDWEKDTMDGGDHLNMDGALKVTAYMGQYLAENTQLLDRRGDTKYNSWSDLYTEYLKQTKQA